MITAFLGELLFHASGLEMSFYRCTNNCAYCFANTKGGEERNPQLKSIDSFIRTASARNTLEADLFNAGYPICISNSSDPFTPKNWRITEQFVKLLDNFENGIFFQTKTSEGLEEVLDAIGARRDRLFYITMTCSDDGVSKIVEPGAPVLEKRIETAILLAKMGFGVVIGFNPYVEKWMPKNALVDVCRRLVENGVRDFFFQPMFMTNRRFQELPVARQKRFSGFENESVPEYCKSYDRWFAMYQSIFEVLEQVENANPFTVQTVNSSPFELYQSKFYKTMPLASEFTTWAVENPKTEYTFEDFWNVITACAPEFFERPHNGIDRYIIAKARDLWRGHPENQNMTSYRKLLRLMWNYPHKFVCSPAGCCFMKVVRRDENGDFTLALTEEPTFIKEIV